METFQVVTEEDIDSIVKDIDSVLLIGRSPSLFKMDFQTTLDLKHQYAKKVENVKMLEVVPSIIPDLPENFNPSSAREFRLCGQGKDSIQVLILWPIQQLLQQAHQLHHDDIDQSDEDENVEKMANTTPAMLSFVKNAKRFLAQQVIFPALEKLRQERRSTFLHGGAVRALTNTSIQLYQQDYLRFCELIDSHLAGLVANGTLSQNQVLFYQAFHGILGEPQRVKEYVLNRMVDHTNIQHFLLAQVHMASTISFKNSKNQIFLFDHRNVRKILSTRRKRQFIPYRPYNIFNYGFFSFKGGLHDDIFGRLHTGRITYVQGYDPAIHLIRDFRNIMSFAAFCLCGHLRDVSSLPLRDARLELLETFNALRHYVDYLKGGNKVRIEIVNSFSRWQDIFVDTFPFSDPSSPQFMDAVHQQLLANRALIKTTGDWFAQHTRYTIGYYITVLERALFNPFPVSLPTSLLQVFYSEILAQFFVFGDTRDMPYKTFLHCLCGPTIGQSVNTRGIIQTKRINRLIKEDADSNLFKTTHMFEMGKHFFIPNLIHVNDYIRILLNRCDPIPDTNVEEFFGTTDDHKRFSRIKNLPRVLGKISRLICHYGDYAYAKCIQTEHLTKRTVTTIFQRNTFYTFRSTYCHIRGSFEPEAVVNSMLRPISVFGNLAVNAVFTPQERKDQQIRALFRYCVQRYVRVFPATLMWGSKDKMPFPNGQYAWCLVGEKSSSEEPTKPGSSHIRSSPDVIALSSSSSSSSSTDEDIQKHTSPASLIHQPELPSSSHHSSQLPVLSSSDEEERTSTITDLPSPVRTASSSSDYETQETTIAEKTRRFQYKEEHLRCIAEFGFHNLPRSKRTSTFLLLARRNMFTGKVSAKALHSKWLRMVDTNVAKRFFSTQQWRQICDFYGK